MNGHRRIVRHDEEELGLLIEHAEQLLIDDSQQVLDLGLTLTVFRRRLVPAPSAGTLLPEAAGTGRERVPRARVLRSAATTLYGALAGVYTSIGFDVVEDALFRDLVIARVVEPTSLLDADRVLAGLGLPAASLSTRKRTLGRVQSRAFRDRLAGGVLRPRVHAR